MNNKIQDIIRKMEELNRKLGEEYSKLAKKYGFSIDEQKIIFLKRFKERNKAFRIPSWKYVIPKDIRHLLSLPFIYMMIIPIVILDIFVTVYHLVAFPLYEIPWVKRKDYIIYDRKFLDYLNIVQKVHCLYCSYVNGFLAYAVEIAGRTERYWCPIKAAHKPITNHDWYEDFADYGNPEEWMKKANDPTAFIKKKEKKEEDINCRL
jgi:hypothetical protein